MSSSLDFLNKRKIIFVSGNRADFDYLSPVLRACLALEAAIEPRLVVTGSHLSAPHGMTETQISQDGFAIQYRIPSIIGPSSPANRARSLARSLLGFLDIMETEKPDALFALGDREEVLVAGIAGAYCSVPFVHYGAGDEAFDGNVDNQVRHAASKLATVHLVGHAAHKRMLEAQGEDPASIHVVGLTSVDSLLNAPDVGDTHLASLLGAPLPTAPWALVVFHPILTSYEDAGSQVDVLLRAVHASGLRAVVGSPNSDAGSDAVRKVLQELAPRLGFLTYSNLPRAAFVSLFRRASILVGNSSMGILEAPAIGMPVVNVGARQGERLRGANVVLAQAESASIRDAIHTALSPEFRARAKASPSPYGGGGSAARIAEILSGVPLPSTKKFDNLRWVFQEASK